MGAVDGCGRAPIARRLETLGRGFLLPRMLVQRLLERVFCLLSVGFTHENALRGHDQANRWPEGILNAR
jgi:hypothetical protein